MDIKTMRLTILLLFTISLLTSCQGKSNHDFTIKGTIKNYHTPISLFEVNNFEGNVHFLQKVQPSTTGTFTFNLKTNEEKLYLLASEDDKQEFVAFINDTSNLIITIDIKTNDPYLVKNSIASKELIDFFIFKNLKAKQITDSIIQQQSSDLTKDSVSLLNSEAQYKSKLIAEFLLYYNKTKHPTVQAFELFNILSLEPTANNRMDEINMLIQKALQQHPDNKYLKDIKQKIASNYFVMKNQNSNSSKLPSFSLPDTEGKIVSIDQFKGKYFLLDFWASWCGPCRQENPYLVKAYNQFKNKNFTIVSISLDENKDAWLNAIKHDNLTWTHLSDLKGWENEVARMFNINHIPYNLLIDPQGNIIAAELRGEALEEKLNEILK